MGDTMREAFEEEVCRHLDPDRANFYLVRDEQGGRYHEWAVMLAWEAYQAAHEAGRQLGMEQARLESNSAMASVLPGPYYMDPPDGGDVSLVEQLRRMAEDARLWREHEQAVPDEPLVRFCPGCGSVGPVPEKYHDCCPDGGYARAIPESLAHRCRDLFQLALRDAIAQPAANAGSLIPTPPAGDSDKT